MKQGKLTNQELNKHILSRIAPKNPETVVGAGVGEDCCAIDFGGELCVISTDPITAAEAKAGMLAIHINANDIAAAGAIPVAALVTMLIPPSASIEQVDDLMEQLVETAEQLNIDITGGHTEVTDSVNRIVVSVTMIGKPANKKVFKTSDMRVGDDIVMTKYAGMEGTAILVDDFFADLEAVLTKEDLEAVEYIKKGLSVVPEGIAAASIQGVSAMHDITEGGVIGAVCEMCEAAGVGAEIHFDAVPVLGVTKKICEHYGIDVYGLISSGSMIITAKDGALVKKTLAQQGIVCSIIGRVVESGVRDASTQKEIKPYLSDELYRVLDKQRA